MRRIRTKRAIVCSPQARRTGFTIIELLVAVSIIALLISILVPTLHGARNAAKNTKTRSMLKSIAAGLELFRQDNEKQYRQTNGYPASHRAEDPATDEEQDIMGAQWLTRSLVGKEVIETEGGTRVSRGYLGFVPRRIVPQTLRDLTPASEAQVRWYEPESNDPPIDRIAPYVSLDALQIVDRAYAFSGTPPNRTWWSWCVANCGSNLANRRLPPKLAPVFVDTFGYPILYYAANAYGKALCVQERGDLYNKRRGYYTHQDNEGFTGTIEVGVEEGWYFKKRRAHPLYRFGPDNLADLSDEAEWGTSFANYIRNKRFQGGRTPQGPTVLKPYNSDTYLLITAGADALYGTGDDINNFERD